MTGATLDLSSLREAIRPFALCLATMLSLCMSAVLGVGAAASDEASSESPAELTSHAERGPVRVDLFVRPAQPVIGDVVVLELVVRAEPDVEVLMPEFGEALGRFEIVDFAPSESLDDQGRAVTRQKYRLQPARSGAQSIPPLRVEFVDRRDGHPPAPDGEDAYEVLTERLSLEVTPILAADDPLDLRPAQPDLGRRRSGGTPWWVWLAGLAAVLAAVGPYAWRAYAAARARRRQRSAS